jgi:[acyl-carrier-protein] S-malonyltransferase
MKIALMFAGQGSQYLGMGKDLVEKYDVCKDIYERAESITGYPIRQISFDDENRLNDTQYTQVCMYTMYGAILALLNNKDIQSKYSMGLSLGEYGAYLHQNVFDFETGLKIVMKRSELMALATKDHPGSMAAVIGLDASILEEMVEKTQDYVTIANYNAPSQLVISGETSAVFGLSEAIKTQHSKRVIPLNTSGAFHSDLMAQASYDFGQYLAQVDLSEPKYNLYLNTLGGPYISNIKHHMTLQLKASVRFYQMVEQMIEDGVDTFIEIGPKRTLSQLLRKINRDVTTLNIEDNESLEKTLLFLEENANV